MAVVETSEKPFNELTGEEKLQRALKKVSQGIWAATVAGTLHGLFELPFVVPLEAAITQTQLNAKGFFHNFRTLFANRQLYRSFSATATGLIPKCWVHYLFLNFWINMLIESGNMRKATQQQNIVVGFLTGASEVWFLTPVNFVKFRMQRPEWGYKNMFDCMARVSREEGYLAFWKGTSAVFWRNSICMVGFVGMYNPVRNLMPFTNKAAGDFSAGVCVGVIGSFMSYPFEMLRAARQHNVPFKEEMLKYGYTMKTFKRLMAGYLPGCARICFHSAALGFLMPRMKEFGEGLTWFRSVRDSIFGAKKA